MHCTDFTTCDAASVSLVSQALDKLSLGFPISWRGCLGWLISVASQLDLVQMSQQSSFITAFVFLELLLCAGTCPSPLRELTCICTQMYRLCTWKSPGLRNSLYLAGRVRIIIVSISQIKKLMLYLGSEAGPGFLGVLTSGQG